MAARATLLSGWSQFFIVSHSTQVADWLSWVESCNWDQTSEQWHV